MVILASKSMASCLDDSVFLGSMIRSIGLADLEPSAGPASEQVEERHSPVDTEPRIVYVLGAVVDEVPQYDRRQDAVASSEGISVLCGSARHMLPKLWSVGLEPKPGRKPSLVLHPPEGRTMGPLRVTVPLANTMFTNGKTHSLSASRWETRPGQSPRFVDRIEKANQTILFRTDDTGSSHDGASTVACNLVPITKPRRIVSGLGNILRQIDIDGPAPASTELETNIPGILDARARKVVESTSQAEDTYSGPVGIWALIMPPGYIEEGMPMAEPLNWQDYHAKSETHLVGETNGRLDLVLAAGGRLCKVCECIEPRPPFCDATKTHRQ